ncbi:MAG: YjdF family protein [Bacillota bacterium]|nr:YjdF family protein [Bacillota bacterium]
MELSVKLTVLFEGAFWVGIFQKSYQNKYEVAKVVFGSEPKDYEVYDFILKNYGELKFTNSLPLEEDKIIINPKRQLREIKKEVQLKGIGTKAQLAMKLQQEANKVERKKLSKEFKEEEKRKKFELRQQKKKLKHNGH